VSKITHIKVLGLALFAVFAFSMVAAASAFAQDEWLFKGEAFVGELETNTEGELTLIALRAGVVLNEIVCSGLFTGDVIGGGPVNLVLDLFSLTGTEIAELGGTSLDCLTTFSALSLVDCEVGLETLLWIEELRLEPASPLTWESLLELMMTEPFFLVKFHHVAFELLCFNSLGINAEILCEGVTSAKAENVAGGVLLEFDPNPAGTILSEEIACPMAPEMGIGVDFLGDVLSVDSTGGILSVS